MYDITPLQMCQIFFSSPVVAGCFPAYNNGQIASGGGINMAYELKSARFLAKDALQQAVCRGDQVADATMGNGHDTLFLAELVGPEGHVYAFDIQESALESTRTLLEAHGMQARVSLFCRSHAELADAAPGNLSAIVFNLGWLPGGDHTVTTRCESTRTAVLAALDLLRTGGILTLCAYPGHPEGAREREMLTALLSDLSNRQYNVLHQRFLNAGEGAPECFVVQKL